MRHGLGRSAAVAVSSAAVTLFVAFGAGATVSQAASDGFTQHCHSFSSQQDAQAEWEKWGPNDPWRWDVDGDGTVCESSPSRPEATGGPDATAESAATPSATTAPAATTPAAAPPTTANAAGRTPPAPATTPTNGGVVPASARSGAASASPSRSPDAVPWSTETPWDGTHTWGNDDSGREHGPRPVGGVQAGGGGLASEVGGVPMVPLAGVAVGAFLLTVGTNRRRRSG